MSLANQRAGPFLDRTVVLRSTGCRRAAVIVTFVKCYHNCAALLKPLLLSLKMTELLFALNL